MIALYSCIFTRVFSKPQVYGEMKEDVYMEQPPGYADGTKNAQEWVWKLNKTLYGAKQSPREARAVLVKEFTIIKAQTKIDEK